MSTCCELWSPRLKTGIPSPIDVFVVLPDHFPEMACGHCRAGADIHPESAIASNYLAQMLAENGEVAEAIEAARQAVAIGGPLQETYRRTLAEIMKRQQANRPGENN